MTVVGALQTVYMPYRSLIEALYTLDSPPVVSFDIDPKLLNPKPLFSGALDGLPRDGVLATRTGLWWMGVLGGFGFWV